MKTTRRDFLKASATIAGVASGVSAAGEAVPSFAADGHLELFKTTKKYDGGAGRQQHGYPPPDQLPL